MKKLLLTVLFLSAISLFGQDTKEPSSSLKDKKIEHFTSFFGNPIDLNIPNAKANYSNNQAKILVEKFFQENTLNVYETKHTGGGSGRPFFEIGKLETTNGNFRTYLLYQKNKEIIRIIEFRIEEE